MTLIAPSDKVRKADTAVLITDATENYPADSFHGMYATQDDKAGEVAIIEPMFKPGVLKAVCQQNNILLQCVDAMIVNVDGTGHTIELVEGQKENESDKQVLTDFFDEPYPGKSMITLRRLVRDDLEQTGVGYIEVSRNIKGDIVMMNHLDCTDMRLLRYDEPVLVNKVVQRAGREMTVQIRARERRFVQCVNGKKTYFKEFGASRELDRATGKWAPKGQTLGIQQRASEILYFTVKKEPKTPYGSPRWINQLPSVLGSRKAEEFNLDFFDAGGLPPVLVVVQGGYLGDGVKDSLQAHLSGKGSKHRAAIVEAISSSGSLDSSGSVKVTVERFGTERQQDSMFQAYDKNCEEHVRVAFRLPPLFIGRSEDYNFATAETGYMVAEAQIFLPERNEFDEVMWQVTKALGVRNYVFKSKALTITGSDQRLSAIELMVEGKFVDLEDAATELNKLAGTNMKYKEPPPTPGFDAEGNPLPKPMPVGAPAPGQTPSRATSPGGTRTDPTQSTPAAKPKLTVVKAEQFEDLSRIIRLSEDWCGVLGLSGASPLSAGELEGVKKQINELEGEDKKFFNELMASRSLVDAHGVEGIAELCGHAVLNLMGK